MRDDSSAAMIKNEPISHPVVGIGAEAANPIVLDTTQATAYPSQTTNFPPYQVRVLVKLYKCEYCEILCYQNIDKNV